MHHCLRASYFFLLCVLQEHEVLHDELNTQNKDLLLRVRELVDAEDAKDARIRELEAQRKGDPVSVYLPTLLSNH